MALAGAPLRERGAEHLGTCGMALAVWALALTAGDVRDVDGLVGLLLHGSDEEEHEEGRAGDDANAPENATRTASRRLVAIAHGTLLTVGAVLTAEERALASCAAGAGIGQMPT